jgi:excisionase family DNA binding protein
MTLNKQLFSIDEVAQQTGFCRAMIYIFLRNGKLAAVKQGRRTFIKRADLMAFIEAMPAFKPRKTAA